MAPVSQEKPPTGVGNANFGRRIKALSQRVGRRSHNYLGLKVVEPPETMVARINLRTALKL